MDGSTSAADVDGGGGGGAIIIVVFLLACVLPLAGIGGWFLYQRYYRRRRRLHSLLGEDDDDGDNNWGSTYEPPTDLSTGVSASGGRMAAPRRAEVGDFDLLKVLGKGAFGTVALVRERRTDTLMAMKVLVKKVLQATGEVDHSRAERDVLARVSHPFITQLYYSFQDDERLYLVMEFAAGGELFRHLSMVGKYTVDQARFYAAEIVLALGALHEMMFVYRDLKPENILLSADGHVRLADFGLSKELDAETSTTSTLVGTPYYAAPEVLRQAAYTFTVDWWTLGVLVYEMMTGKCPFYSPDYTAMYKSILRGTYDPSLLPGSPGDGDGSGDADVSEGGASRDFVARLLTVDASERLGADGGAGEVKAHPWFASVDFDAVLATEIEPPFVPALRRDTDLSMFDVRFTTMDVNEEVNHGGSGSLAMIGGSFEATSANNRQFRGFTYVADDSVLDGAGDGST